ncbi:M23 family metallopeptidase [Campylobacter sp. RM12637]|uniref:M23 family metallopeptidase n=1 Tax=Campylobacter sp. RM12637 TaxID=2735734 RepID=UPI00301509FB|nr:M23 family metallopeptidase [Campylobacter sp. RM12637]
MKKLFFISFFTTFLLSNNLINGKVDISIQNPIISKSEITYTKYPINNKTLLILAPNYRASGKTLNITLDNQEYSLKVLEGEYKKEQIKLAKPSIIKPNKKLQERIAKEYDEAVKIYAKSTEKVYINKPFIIPLDSVITSPFGSARVFENTLKSYHSGTDFRAAIGVSIPASNDGVVVIAKDRYYSGGSVVIDHGYGVYSQYYHLSKINVKVGDFVKQSDIIGLSGDTGRVSGPHLHFGIAIKGVSVDPLDFVNKFNAKAFN